MESTRSGILGPLVVQPPELAGVGPLQMVSVQHMLDSWGGQEDTHAAMHGPPAMILQAGRFDFDVRRGRALKRRYEIWPDTQVNLPVFENGLTQFAQRYQLCSIIVHRGDSPDSGHYFNLYYDAREGSYRVADDNVGSVSIDEEELYLYTADMYVFFYIRCR